MGGVMAQLVMENSTARPKCVKGEQAADVQVTTILLLDDYDMMMMMIKVTNIYLHKQTQTTKVCQRGKGKADVQVTTIPLLDDDSDDD